MPIFERYLVPAILATSLATTPAAAQKQFAHSPQILSAKTIYFKNQTGSDAVGENAVAQLKKWGRFQIIHDQKRADLILLLSSEPYQQGNPSSQGGGLDDGDVDYSGIPKWDRQKPTKYAYLTVIDPKSGESLWSAEHLWGGLLTGFNSAGERLVKELQNQTKH
jgi:hypothetical protein